MTGILTACGGDETTAPITEDPAEGSFTIDASTTPARVALGDPVQVVSVADPASSTAWDFGALGTTITSNGGAAGPGGVTLYCLCRNQQATAAHVQAMTPESELTAFEAVTMANVPAADAFTGDELSPAIAGWFEGTAGPAATARASRHWIVRLSTTSGRLGKLRVTQISGATTAAAGTVTFEVATQPAAGGDFGATRTVTVTAGAAPVRVNLTTGTVTDGTDWDLALSGWTIRVNGGVSGSGGVATVATDDPPFADMSATIAATVPAQAFRPDVYAGVFAQQPWYRYNITGGDHQIWPTYEVYLLRRGSAVWKLQFTGYYSANGKSGQITFRYARLQ